MSVRMGRVGQGGAGQTPPQKGKDSWTNTDGGRTQESWVKICFAIWKLDV